jgi:hypothetical protein
LLARIVLRELGAPALVSSVNVDAAEGNVIAAEGCRIDKLQVAAGGLSFDRLDQALPMPVLQFADPSLVLDDLSRYMLKVSWLKAPRYTLAIDGEKIREFTKEELAEGLNLTLCAGPITRQAQQVMTLVDQKNAAFSNSKAVEIFNLPEWLQHINIEEKRKAEMAKRDKAVTDLEGQINVALKPKPHKFELRPVGTQ